ncbi:DUF3052 family protein [Leptospira idonii]|uniref:DUF3052 family protein n=1 Tax=Leptospira idonii TaxID=1193500 RepID=A0A4R9M0T5_9LEPT|nr:DUF3052 family protein [Leptospira idonii]
MRVHFLSLPEEVKEDLSVYLAEAEVSKTLKGKFDYLHLFTKETAELEKKFPVLVEHLAEKGMIWISWPKGSSKVPTDVNENLVREIGLKLGIVDVKVCAVSSVWSGLKFYRRKI